MNSTFYSSSFSRKFFALLAGLSLALYTVPLTFAASVYAALPATGTVGTSITSLELEYTVDTAVQTWANADTLVINLPPNIGPTGWAGLASEGASFAVEFDEDVTNDGTAEVDIIAGGGDGQYAVSGPNLTIRWNQTAWTADNTDTIRVLISTVTPKYTDTTTDFLFSGATAAGGDTNPSGTASLNIAAGSANAATVSFAGNSVVGTAGNTTIAFSPLVTLDSADTIEITFPAHVSVTSAAYVSTTLATGSGSPTISSCSGAGQILTCTVGGTGNFATTAGNIVVSGIAGLYSSSSTIAIGDFQIEDENVSANDIAINTSAVTLTAVTAGDAGASIVLVGNQVEGTTGVTTVTLSIAKDLDADDTVDITFPSYLDVSGVSFTSESFAGAGTFTSCTETAQMVTCTANGAITAGTGDIVLAGIVAFTTGTADVELLEVENEGIDGANISSDLVVALTDVVATETSSGSSSGGGSHGGGGSSSSSNDDDEEDEEDENPFTDISSSDDYYEEILELYELGVIDGYPDGSIKEQNGMNRAELMKIVVLAVTDEPSASVYKNCYSDVTTQWFAPYVCYATEQGWVSGYPDGTFKPADTANNVEVLKMILNTNDVEVSEVGQSEAWYAPYVNEADSLGLINAESFSAASTATRGYAFNILADLLGMM